MLYKEMKECVSWKGNDLFEEKRAVATVTQRYFIIKQYPLSTTIPRGPKSKQCVRMSTDPREHCSAFLLEKVAEQDHWKLTKAVRFKQLPSLRVGAINVLDNEEAAAEVGHGEAVDTAPLVLTDVARVLEPGGAPVDVGGLVETEPPGLVETEPLGRVETEPPGLVETEPLGPVETEPLGELEDEGGLGVSPLPAPESKSILQIIVPPIHTSFAKPVLMAIVSASSKPIH